MVVELREQKRVIDPVWLAFLDEIFLQKHDSKLLEEDDRLAKEDAGTREWYERVVKA